VTVSAFLDNCLRAHPDRDPASTVGDWFSFRTHVGLARSENQDRVAVARWIQRGEVFWVVVVADGVGSGRAGGDAASAAVAQFVATLAETGGRSLEERLAHAAETANQSSYRRWRGREGTTLSAVLSSAGQAASLNIGDSRIYGIGAEGNCRLLTTDDTIAAVPGLLQFVGMGQDLVPHTQRLSEDVARVLLTTDGVHAYVGPLLEHLVATAGANTRVLVDRLTHLSLWCGGGDNATTAVAALGGDATLRSSQSIPALEVWTPGIRHHLSGRIRIRGRAGGEQRGRRRKATDTRAVSRAAPSTAGRTRPSVTMTFEPTPGPHAHWEGGTESGTEPRGEENEVLSAEVKDGHQSGIAAGGRQDLNTRSMPTAEPVPDSPGSAPDRLEGQGQSIAAAGTPESLHLGARQEAEPATRQSEPLTNSRVGDDTPAEPEEQNLATTRPPLEAEGDVVDQEVSNEGRTSTSEETS
jgi:PPM family protein phosphatase